MLFTKENIVTKEEFVYYDYFMISIYSMIILILYNFSFIDKQL